MAATPAPVPATVVAAKPSPAAEADLLLYLSEFEDAQGEWVDPADLPPSTPPPGEDDDAP